MKWDEYQIKKYETFNAFGDGQTWLKTDIECPKCGEPIYVNTSVVLTTYPPKYKYQCNKCKWTEAGY